ncbi:Zn-dependent exopeptidase [Marasmius fiardii PR-910]|nr:Zn-dependent exopeptidase [Marasmius fiardii PR-910]
MGRREVPQDRIRVIVKIAGSSSTSQSVTILGAHQDSINGSNRTNGRAPGADDDGSGTAGLIKTFRALASAGYKPSTPLEFHFYAAEEGGLLGSQDIATSYKNAGVDVKAQIQFDMIAYFKPGSREVISLHIDYVSSELNAFVVKVAQAYSRIPAELTRTCGYACSDHASWNRAGYPTSFPFEATTENYNPYIHTDGDTVDVAGFSWTHALEFVELALGAAIELTAF